MHTEPPRSARRSSVVTSLRLAWSSFLFTLLAMGCSGGGTREGSPLPATPDAEAGSAVAASPIATQPTPAPSREHPGFVPSPGARDLRTLFVSPGSPLPVRQRAVQPLPAPSF